MVKITPNMTTKSINNVLALGGKITFAAGTYNLSDTLILTSNSDIKCDGNVVFNKKTSKPMMMTKVTKNTTVFKGAHDITWEGGKFVGDTNSATSNMILLFHAKNVSFVGCTFTGCVGLHFVEINGCKGIKILNCNFSNHKTKSGKEHKESIQIDFANYDGVLYGDAGAKYYDGTHCRDIVIYDCHFNNCRNGIGTHTVTYEDKHHKGITIDYCKMDGCKLGGMGIKLLNMRDVTVSNCTIENFDNGIYIYKSATGHLNHGGTTKLDSPKMCENITLTNNTLRGNINDLKVK